MRLLLLMEAEGVVRGLAAALAASGFGHDRFARFEDGLEALQGLEYSAMILESTLADGDVCAWLAAQRARHVDVPAAVLLRDFSAEHRVRAYEAGADDCVPLSVTPREMVVRLRALLRRPSLVAPAMLAAGNVELDIESRQVTIGGRPVPIPRRELSLLEHLMRRQGRVVPRGQLEGDLYGHSATVAPNSVEVRVSRVRRHLQDAGANVAIRTARGTGYVLEAREDDDA